MPDEARPTRLRKWVRRVLVAVVELVGTATLFSFGYNAVTAGRAGEPVGLRFVSADGIRTRYRQWGSGGAPVVLVHGAAESADTWARVARLLAANRRVYALDLTGWGYSQRRGPYDAEHEAGQPVGFLDALHLERATLVGHSTGAAVVAAAVLRAPGRVGGVVFLDGDGLDTGAGAGAGDLQGVLPNPYRTTLLRLAVRSDWVIRQIYGSQCGPLCPRLDGAGVDEWRRPLQITGAEHALWSMRGIVGLPAARLAALRRIAVPKRVIFGAEDDVFPHSSISAYERSVG